MMGRLDDLLADLRATAPQTLRATADVIGGHAAQRVVLRYLAAAHEDPQVAAAVADWERRTSRTDAELLAEELRVGFLDEWGGCNGAAMGVMTDVIQKRIDDGKLTPGPNLRQGDGGE